MNRRKLLKAAVGATLALGAGGAYPFAESKWCRVTRETAHLPNLPAEFEGLKVAFLADTHHGPHASLDYIRHAVSLANAANPDLVLLGGDYVSKSSRYIAPGIAELGKLRAKIGRFGVLGNHDFWEGIDESKAALASSGITELTNRGVWIERGNARLRLAGVGDVWTDEQDIKAALGDATDRDAVLLLSHNPDFAETVEDERIGLMLSGHTHGGQVVLPGYGAPVVPSSYGQKYLQGFVQGPACRVFITRGVGTSGPPVRFQCRPEVVILTLAKMA